MITQNNNIVGWDGSKSEIASQDQDVRSLLVQWHWIEILMTRNLIDFEWIEDISIVLLW